MSQHDMDVANGSGAAVRADLNLALLALASVSSGATAPATTFAYMWWADTTTGLLKQRNAANSAWITVCQLSDWALPSVQGQFATAFTTGGTSTAYTLTPTPAITALTTNQRWRVTFHTAAGETPTLAVSGTTAKNLKYKDSAGSKRAITSTQVPTGWVSDVEYDGTDYVVLQPVGVMTASVGGYVPTPPNNTTTFLRGDGTFAAPSAAILSASYNSGNQTISSGGLLTLTHDLGAVPKLVQFFAVCLTAESGYSIGDVVLISAPASVYTGAGSSSTGGFTVLITSTDITIRFSSGVTNPIVVFHKTTGVMAGLTNANWGFVVKAYA